MVQLVETCDAWIVGWNTSFLPLFIGISLKGGNSHSTIESGVNFSMHLSTSF